MKKTAFVVPHAEEIMVQFFDGEAIGAKTFRISRFVLSGNSGNFKPGRI